MSACRKDASPDEEARRWFEHDMRQAAERDGIIIDCSRMASAADYTLYFEAVQDGRLDHVAETIGGVRQVPFFRITDAGRAWIAGVPQ